MVIVFSLIYNSLDYYQNQQYYAYYSKHQQSTFFLHNTKFLSFTELICLDIRVNTKEVACVALLKASDRSPICCNMYYTWTTHTKDYFIIILGWPS